MVPESSPPPMPAKRSRLLIGRNSPIPLHLPPQLHLNHLGYLLQSVPLETLFLPVLMEQVRVVGIGVCLCAIDVDVLPYIILYITCLQNVDDRSRSAVLTGNYVTVLVKT